MHPDAVLEQTRAIRALSVEQKLQVAESLRTFAWQEYMVTGSVAAIAYGEPRMTAGFNAATKS